MITSILAPNPGPMTLEGTRTWIIGDDGPALVVDPGPADQGHLQAILDACPHGVAEIWLTHHHHDHTELVPDLVAATGARVRARSADLCQAAEPFVDAEEAEVAGSSLQILTLPGHTADSVGFVYQDQLLSGDTILGRGTTVINDPDGHLGDYLNSLDRIAELTASGAVRRILPAHGPDVDDAAATVQQYRAHREERLDQVRAALAAGATTAAEVVAQVYTDVPEQVLPAAEASVRAQLVYLNQQ